MHTVKYPSDDKLRNAVKIALDNDHPEKMQQYSRGNKWIQLWRKISPKVSNNHNNLF
jgi:hypothetical protein